MRRTADPGTRRQQRRFGHRCGRSIGNTLPLQAAWCGPAASSFILVFCPESTASISERSRCRKSPGHRFAYCYAPIEFPAVDNCPSRPANSENCDWFEERPACSRARARYQRRRRILICNRQDHFAAVGPTHLLATHSTQMQRLSSLMWQPLDSGLLYWLGLNVPQQQKAP